ncbi:hypothetical protein AGIG_G20818 [Arapaima gigas]
MELGSQPPTGDRQGARGTGLHRARLRSEGKKLAAQRRRQRLGLELQQKQNERRDGNRKQKTKQKGKTSLKQLLPGLKLRDYWPYLAVLSPSK